MTKEQKEELRQGDLRSAFEAMNIISLDEVLNTSGEPVNDTSRTIRIRAFLYQLCQNDTESFIIDFLLQGFTMKEIGSLLGVSKQNIGYHLSKLQARVKENKLCVSDVI